MDKKAVIPTPRAQQWREFRMTVLPRATVACTLLAVIFLWRAYVIPPTVLGEAESRSARVTTPNSGSITNFDVSQFQKFAREASLPKSSAVNAPN